MSEKKEPPIPIRLEAQEHQLQLRIKEVRRAEQALRDTEIALAQYHIDNRKELRKKILKKNDPKTAADAQTTGDEFTDEILCAFGYDRRKIDLLRKLNEQFVGREDEECLIVVPRVHKFPSNIEEIDFAQKMCMPPISPDLPVLGIILGTLSGDRIRVTSDESPQSVRVHLPFKDCVEIGFPHRKEPRKEEGVFLVSGFSLENEELGLDELLESVEEPGERPVRVIIGKHGIDRYNDSLLYADTIIYTKDIFVARKLLKEVPNELREVAANI